VKGLLVSLAFALAACSSAPAASPTPTDPPSWLGMDPGDARAFSGPSGRLVLLVADETYSIDGTYASALIWKHGTHYTTDYYVQAPDGSLWWFGRKGAWHAGRHGEQKREVDLDHGTATFGDRAITPGEDGPVQLQAPDGIYRVD
jgi:hypothetical protein